MSQMTTLAFVAPWAINWLTPLWLLSVGVFLGMAILLVFWLLAAALSRLPLGRLAEQRGSRGAVAGLVGLVCFLLLAGLFFGPLWTGQGDGGGVTSDNLPMVAVNLALVAALVGAALVWLTSRRTVNEVPSAVREGPLWPIFILAASLSAFAVVGVFIAFNPTELLSSLARMPNVGTATKTFTIPAPDLSALGEAADPPQRPIDISFRSSELRQITFRSSETITVDFEAEDDLDLDPLIRVTADEEAVWRMSDSSPLEAERVNQLYVRNYGVQDAELSVTVMTEPQHPEVRAILPTALGTCGIFLLYLLQRAAMPRVSAVSLSTLKSEMAQPLFLVMLLVGIAALILFIWIPYNTFGEDIKVLKDSGLTLIMVLCIILAVWAASTSVSEEIEGRTALTVLSKPINRRSFIIGKFLGISWTVLVMFVLLGFVLLVVTAYKPIYDARETADTEPLWQECHFEMVGVVPGLLLGLMETLVLVALSVAISTRLPLLANFVICFTIYVLGHLTPLLVQSSVGDFAPVEFIATLLAAALPVLDHFNIQAAIAAGIDVPPDYLGWSLVYCLIYGMIALLLALVLFEDRDLA